MFKKRFIRLAFYEIMWQNTVEPDRPQMTIWRRCVACWISKATSTHSEYVILIAFPLQQWLHKRPSMYTAFLVEILRHVAEYTVHCVFKDW